MVFQPCRRGLSSDFGVTLGWTIADKMLGMECGVIDSIRLFGGGQFMSNVFDWDSIKADYVQGFWRTDPETGVRHIYYPTLEDVAGKHSCSLGHLKNVAGRDKWRYQRSVFRAKINEYQQERRTSLFFSESAQLDAFVLSASKDLGKLVQQKIGQLQPGADEETENNLNAQPEYAALERMIGLKATKPNFKTSDLHTLAKTLDILQVIGRRAVGEPISGINQHDTAAVQPDGDPEDRKHRIEELLKRRQQLEVQIKQIKKQSS